MDDDNLPIGAEGAEQLRRLANRKGQPLRKWLRDAGLASWRPSNQLSRRRARWVIDELNRLPDVPAAQDAGG